MGHIAEGARLVFGDRRLWRYMIVPWFWSILIFVGLVAIGYVTVVPWLQALLTPSEGSLFRIPAQMSVVIFYFLTWFFIAGFVFLTITSLTSAFFWEKLSAAIEERITGQPAPLCKLSGRELFADSAIRGMFTLAMAMISLVCGFCLPIVGPLIFAGWIGLLDYTSPAFLRYGRTVTMQWPVVRRMPGWFVFQLTAGGLSFVPLVNVLLLPVLVAGGTVMAVRSGILVKPSSSSTSPA